MTKTGHQKFREIYEIFWEMQIFFSENALKKVVRPKNYDLEKQKLDSAKIWPPLRFWSSGSASV